MVPQAYFLEEFYLSPVLYQRQFYRFTTTTTDFLNKNRGIEKALTRLVTLTYYGKRKELFVFKAFTSKVITYFNRTIQNDRFLKENIKAFGRIEIGVNDKGVIVQLYNLNEMQQRWELKKAELRKDNSGYDFDVYLNGISNVLRNEEKVIFFLNSKNMFGLYFNGLFGKYDINNVPIKRKAVILGLKNIAVAEEFWTDNRIPGFKIVAQKSDGEQEKISSNDDVIKKYEGELIYSKDNQLMDGILEIESENRNIKHSVLWVG